MTTDMDIVGEVRRRPRGRTGYAFVQDRELGKACAACPDLVSWIEGQTLRRLDAGRYVGLDRDSQLVRSTISIAFSHDGRFFASTHGDHSVKVFEYPSGKQIACLDGHPRTPWTVRFHPTDSAIMATGCLGHECRVWNLRNAECVRKHSFSASISCVSFTPDGSLLAVTSGKNLLLWNYTETTSTASRSTSTELDGLTGPGLPLKLLEGANPFHMVDFHPSGTMLMTGEKNRYVGEQPGSVPTPTEQFTLKLVIHRFDRRMHRAPSGAHFSGLPVLTVPRAVAYNDAGIHFSPCGTMLAACIPAPGEDRSVFHIAVLSVVNSATAQIGSVLFQAPLDKGHVTALTNLKFSSTSEHLLAGFSFRPQNPVLRVHAEQYGATADGRNSITFRRPQVRVVDIYNVSEKFEMIRSLCADIGPIEGDTGADDEINVAVFAPSRGVADGVVYGTQKGRVRMFQQATGSPSVLRNVCENAEFDGRGGV